MGRDGRTTATLVRTERASQVRVTGGICVNQASKPTTGIWIVVVRSAAGEPVRGCSGDADARRGPASALRNSQNYDLRLLTPPETRSDVRYVSACSHCKRSPSL